MVFTIMTVWYPMSEGSEVAKRYIESLKKYPPDPSLSKTVVIGVRPTKDGVKVVAVGEAVKGKFEESFLRSIQSTHEFMQDVKGFRYEIETFLDITEAMPVVGMTAPEER